MNSIPFRIITQKLRIKKNYFSLRKLSDLSYIHNVGKDPLRALTIGNLFEESALKFGDKTALVSVYDNRRITFQQVIQEANKLATGLHSLGLQKGDRVALWAPNVIEWVTTMVAIAQAGLVTVALNPINHQRNDLEYFLNKVGVKALVCLDEYKTYKFYDTLCSLLPELETQNPGKLSSKKVPSLKSVITISNNSLRGTYNFNEVLNKSDRNTVYNFIKNSRVHTPDAIANIQYTSGTTGKPKGTCISHFQQVNNAYGIGKRMGLDSNQNFCVLVPFFHVSGTIVCTLAAQHFGTTLTLPSPIYSPSANLKAIEEEKCTVACGTPTMFVDLANLQIKEKREINLSTAVTGGAPCLQQTFREMKEVLNTKKIILKLLYGMTETSAVSFQSLLEDEDEHKITNTVGYIGEHLEAKVVDKNDNIVPLGTPGELCIRGYSVMLGYWDDDDKTKEVYKADKWLRTSDLFILRHDGYGVIVDRLKDMILRGGENIFPKEIEDVLNAHPDILESQVIGVSDERLGEEVCACLKLKDNVNFNYDDIMEYCKDKLTAYKLPSHFKVVENFPRTASGKVQKFMLKKQIEQNR